jgi:hypothetical protein
MILKHQWSLKTQWKATTKVLQKMILQHQWSLKTQLKKATTKVLQKMILQQLFILQTLQKSPGYYSPSTYWPQPNETSLVHQI